MTTALAWLAHNTIGHPLMGLLHLAGDAAQAIAFELWRLGDRVHDLTCPESTPRR